MPTYEYRCKSCGKTHEIAHGFNDQRPTKCPSCGGELVRVFHPIGLVFKGSGFHKTDYGGASSRAPTESNASDGKGADAKPGEKKSDSGGAETKSGSASSDSASTKADKPKSSDSASGSSSSST